MIDVACAGDRNNEWLLRQHPSQRKLGGRSILLLSKPFDQINHWHICRYVFRRNTGEARSQVHFRVELGSSIYFPSKVSLSNRAPRDEADPQLLASREHAVVFRVSLHQR